MAISRLRIREIDIGCCGVDGVFSQVFDEWTGVTDVMAAGRKDLWRKKSMDQRVFGMLLAVILMFGGLASTMTNTV